MFPLESDGAIMRGAVQQEGSVEEGLSHFDESGGGHIRRPSGAPSVSRDPTLGLRGTPSQRDDCVNRANASDSRLCGALEVHVRFALPSDRLYTPCIHSHLAVAHLEQRCR
eukprot:794259-Pyramimonas_sp.AAC.1